MKLADDDVLLLLFVVAPVVGEEVLLLFCKSIEEVPTAKRSGSSFATNNSNKVLKISFVDVASVALWRSKPDIMSASLGFTAGATGGGALAM
jgi:hypothetical protein